MTTYQWEQAHEPMPSEVRDNLIEIRKAILVLAWLPNRRSEAAPKGLDGLASELDKRCGSQSISDFISEYLQEQLPTLEEFRKSCNEAMAYPAASWIEEIRQSWEDETTVDISSEISADWLETQAELIRVTIEEDLQQAFGDGHRMSL